MLLRMTWKPLHLTCVAILMVIVLLWLYLQHTSLHVYKVQRDFPDSKEECQSLIIAKVNLELDLAADDPLLINCIRSYWLVKPFPSDKQVLREPHRTHYSQRNQSEFVDRALRHRANGFFIEAGAADGEYLSNSLFFERQRKWSGLLVEANPEYFKSVLKKQRHAHMINTCLSPKRHPVVLEFRQAGYIGGLVDTMEDAHKDRVFQVHGDVPSTTMLCFPLASILKALGITHIDYFSLDIEGAELDVLQTIPLDEITINIFSIEYRIREDKPGTKKKLESIEHLLVDQHGYNVIRLDDSEDVILMKN